MKRNLLRSSILMIGILAFLLTGLHHRAFSQSLSGDVRLQGRVLDAEAKSPLPGANLYLVELDRGTSSDKDGFYQFEKLRAGRYEITVSFIGYEDLKTTVQLAAGDNKHDFRLKQQPIELPQTTVVVDRNHERLDGSTQSLEIVTPEEMEKTRGQTLGEALKFIPGVSVLQTGPSISKPVIRGLHSQRILVLNTGVPQEGQQWGGEHAPEIDPFAPARIEVLKGAAGVQYGAGAIGGVIRLEPRELPTHTGIGGQLTLNGFSNNRQASGSLLLEGAMPQLPGFGWRLQGSLRKAGDSKTPDYVIGNSGFSERDYSAALGYHAERRGIDAYYSHFGTELGIFRGSHIGNLTDLQRAIERGQPSSDAGFSYDIRAPKQKISHNLLSIKAHQKFPSVGRVELQYGWQQNHRQEFDAHAPFSTRPPTTPSFDLTLTTHTLDMMFQHYPRGNFTGKIGVSGMRQGNVENGTILLIPNFRAYSGGAFLFESWVKNGVTLEAGARYDYRWVKVFRLIDNQNVVTIHRYDNMTGVAGATYQFATHWSISANAGTAWRPPSINELYSDGVHHGTAQYEIGDLNLTTEKGLSLDATLRHHSERAHFELSVYNNSIRDFIYLYPDPNPTLTIRGAFPTFRYRQADAVLRGFDASCDYRLINIIEIGATASIVRGENLDSDEPLISMPSDRFRLSLGFDLPDFGIFRQSTLKLSETVVRKQDRVPANADYAAPPPGYNLLDVDLSTKLLAGGQVIQMNLSIQNVFNTAYRDYLSRFRYFTDDTGRSIVLRANIPFGDFDK